MMLIQTIILLCLHLLLQGNYVNGATWTTATLSVPRAYFTATSVGNLALFAGGFNNNGVSNRVDIYFANNDSWTFATLSQARQHLTATSVEHFALFAGGADAIGDLDVVDIYDASTNTWTTATLSVARKQLAATSVGTLALFAGGANSPNAYSQIVDIFNATSGTWSTAILSQKRQDLVAITVANFALFAGGQIGTNFYTNRVDIYDYDTDTWSTATLSEARTLLAAARVRNLALFGGGQIDPFEFSEIVDIYDADHKTWSTATLSSQRHRIAATSLGDMAIFAFGASYDYVDIYHANNNSWTMTTIPPVRDKLTATSVGSVAMFAGGQSIEGYLDKVEVLFHCQRDEDCSDSEICNGVERCIDGYCVPGENLSFNTPCDDGLFCNGDDYCDSGICLHRNNACNEYPECQRLCVEETDSCENEPNGTPCLINGSSGGCTGKSLDGNTNLTCNTGGGICELDTTSSTTAAASSTADITTGSSSTSIQTTSSITSTSSTTTTSTSFTSIQTTSSTTSSIQTTSSTTSTSIQTTTSTTSTSSTPATSLTTSSTSSTTTTTSIIASTEVESITDTSTFSAEITSGDTALDSTAIVVIVVVPIALIIFIILVIVLVRHRKNEHRRSTEGGRSPEEGTIELLPTSQDKKDSSLKLSISATPKILLPAEHVTIVKRLGNFGEVYLGTYFRADVALKKLKDNEGLDEFQRELELLITLQHPNIVRCFGMTIKDDQPYMVTEFVSGGSLLDLLKQKGDNFKFETHINLILNIGKGMLYLENNKIIHRDLACRNCLVAPTGKNTYQVKVADFGMSRQVDRDEYTTKNAKIPVRWSAPEVLQQGQYSTKADVWSFGIVMWEIFERGQVPYGHWRNNKQVVEDVLKGVRLDKPSNCTEEVFNIMQECWRQDPAKRPSFDSLVSKITAITQDEQEYDNATQHAVGEGAYESTQPNDIPEYNNPNYTSQPF